MKVGSKRAIWALPLAVLAAFMILIVTDLGGFASFVRNTQFDAYQTLHPRPYEDPGPKTNLTVRTLDIDQAAVAKFGPWPWAPATLAHVLDKLKQNDAALAVLDFPLDQSAAGSPAQFAALLPPGPENDAARKTLLEMPAPSDALSQAMANMRTVTGFSLRQTAGARMPQLRRTIAIEGAPSARALVPQFSFAAAADAKIEAASAGVGALNIVPDSDGKVRGVPMLFMLDGRSVASLDAEVLRLAAAREATVLQASQGQTPVLDDRPRFLSAKSGLIAVPLRNDGLLAIYFSKVHTRRNISAAALDADTLPKGALRNAIVYIGAPDAMVETPLGPRTVSDVRAEAMENILLGTALKPADELPAQLVILAVLGIGIAAVFARLGTMWAGLATVLAIAALEGATWSIFTSTQLLLDSANPSLALALSFGAGLGARGAAFVKGRLKFRGAFSNALAPAMLDRLAGNPSLLKLDGEARTITYLTCGVRSYAALVESFRDDPAGFTRMMRTALDTLVKEVFAMNGTLDHYAGEGFTAYWNAPLDDGEHAIHACEAANRMTVALARVNEQLAGERRLDGTAYEPIEIGISIATGLAIAGGFGGSGRLAYAVTGDCTQVAERVRALSAQYGPAVIVTEDTRKAAERGFAFLEVDFIAAGIREEPLKLYAMLGNPLVRASPKFRAMATFHEHIFSSIQTRQWEKARDLIEQCRKLSGASQKMYDLHLKRISYYEANPPEQDWDGAFRQILK